MIAKDLIGKFFSKIAVNFVEDVVEFYDDKGIMIFEMRHVQDCCEQVCIHRASFIGLEANNITLSDVTILEADETEPDLPPIEPGEESYLWTVYDFTTDKGKLIIEWYGTSNGYYGEMPSIYPVVFVEKAPVFVFDPNKVIGRKFTCNKGHKIEVHMSAAGYYIGAKMFSNPICRVSGYFKTKEEALKRLYQNDFIFRFAPENQYCGCMDNRWGSEKLPIIVEDN